MVVNEIGNVGRRKRPPVSLSLRTRRVRERERERDERVERRRQLGVAAQHRQCQRRGVSSRFHLSPNQPRPCHCSRGEFSLSYLVYAARGANQAVTPRARKTRTLDHHHHHHHPTFPNPQPAEPDPGTGGGLFFAFGRGAPGRRRCVTLRRDSPPSPFAQRV